VSVSSCEGSNVFVHVIRLPRNVSPQGRHAPGYAPAESSLRLGFVLNRVCFC
jgi:hypothetical protein